MKNKSILSDLTDVLTKGKVFVDPCPKPSPAPWLDILGKILGRLR